MKLVAVNGSPRIGGNTEIALKAAADGARQKGAMVDTVVLNNLKFVPCQECENIREDGTCLIIDDMQIVYQKIGEADALIIASPIFFGGLSAQTKMMVDRFQCAWYARNKFGKDLFGKKKRGAFIAVSAGHRRDFFKNASSIVKNLFAVINVSYDAELFIPGVDDRGAVLEHPERLEEARSLGVELCR